MKQKENEKKNDKRKKSSVCEFLDMVRGIWSKTDVQPEDFRVAPAPATVEKLIGKAVGEKLGRSVSENPDGVAGGEEERKGCPYAMKRAIVASLEEIRRFAQEHDLAATVVRALLTLLAEMVVDALKGKVSGRVLEMLLKALRFDSVRKEAYDEGHLAGRNARIETELFAEEREELPDITGADTFAPTKDSIFNLAKDAK